MTLSPFTAVNATLCQVVPEVEFRLAGFGLLGLTLWLGGAASLPTFRLAGQAPTTAQPDDLTESVGVLDDDHCDYSGKDRDEVTLRQGDTTTEGSKCREREQLAQLRVVRPRHFHLAADDSFVARRLACSASLS
jgi:hypothetical protein